MAQGRPPSAKTLVDRQLGRNIKHPVLPAGDSFIVPNHSGDHSEGRVDKTPTQDLDLVNKKYVDDQFPVTHTSTTGQTTDDHHNESHTVASHSDTTATGAELNTLTDDSMADTLHRHSELSSEDGIPNRVVFIDSAGNVFIDGDTTITGSLDVVGKVTTLTFSGAPLVLNRVDTLTGIRGVNNLRRTTNQNIAAGAGGQQNFQLNTADTSLITYSAGVYGTDDGTTAEGFYDIQVRTGSVMTSQVYISGSGVKLNNNLTFIGSGGLPYAEIYVNDNTTVTSVSSAGFTQFLHFDTNGHNNNSTPDHTEDHITITKAGVYMVECCVNIKNDSGAAHDIEVVIAKNNNATIFPNMRRHRTLGTGSDIGAIPICGHLDLAVDDTIEVWITSDSGSARNVIAEDVVLMLTQVGGT